MTNANVPWQLGRHRVGYLCRALGFGGALALLTPTVYAAEPDASTQSLWQETQSAAVLAGGLTVSLNHDTLHDGEALVISVNVPARGYLNVVSIGPDGEATVLFTNKFNRDNLVPSGPLVIPTQEMQFDLQATAPFGPTLVAAFLSQEKLDFAALDGAAGLEDTFAHLSPAARGRLSDLNTRSLTVVARATPMVLGGTAEVLTCAASAPCNKDSAEVTDLPDHMVPGIFLDADERGLEPLGAPPRRVYQKGLQLTESAEGFVPHLYNDAVHYCTVAYGHLVEKAACNGREPQEFLHGVTRPQGNDLLAADMQKAERAVQSAVKVVLSDGQFAALSDFTYNVGAGNLRTSTLLKVINRKEFDSVESQFMRWVTAAGKALPGLVERRKHEVALFFEGVPRTRGLAAEPELPAIDIRAGEQVP